MKIKIIALMIAIFMAGYFLDQSSTLYLCTVNGHAPMLWWDVKCDQFIMDTGEVRYLRSPDSRNAK